MLTEKDYCDYETCVALKELEYVGSSRYYYTQRDHKFHYDAYNKFYTVRTADAMGYVLAVHLYEAQKFLREEKKLIVLVGFDFCPMTSEIVYNWVIVVNGNTVKKSSYTYDYFEEALLEGVKCAVKLLKEK